MIPEEIMTSVERAAAQLSQPDAVARQIIKALHKVAESTAGHGSNEAIRRHVDVIFGSIVANTPDNVTTNTENDYGP